MAKNLTKETLPSQFRELADVLEGGRRVGWSVGSAEARWITRSEEEWGKPLEGEDAVSEIAEQQQTAGA